MGRFFIEGTSQVGAEVCLTEADSKHLVKVLRFQLGAKVQVVAANQVFTGELIETSPLAKVKLLTLDSVCNEADLEVYLLQGIAKGERMDVVIQKCVELGVHTIIPTACERCVVQIEPKKAESKVVRWQKIAEAAAKQSGRNRIAQIAKPCSLEQAIKSLPEDTFLIMPWEEADASQSLKQVFQSDTPKRVGVIIGPEGGLTQSEADLAKAHNARIVTLGKRILRTETAAIVMLALLMYEWGDIN